MRYYRILLTRRVVFRIEHHTDGAIPFSRPDTFAGDRIAATPRTGVNAGTKPEKAGGRSVVGEETGYGDFMFSGIVRRRAGGITRLSRDETFFFFFF